MTRRRKIQLISVIAAALIALIGTTISGYVLAGRYRTDLEYGYRRAFNDLSEHVTGMENALNKVTYANTPTQQHGITALLMKEASSAKASLAVLPLGGDSMDTVQKFVAQVEDFSSSLSTKISAGEALTDDDENTLFQLGQYAALLKSNLAQVNQQFAEQNLQIGETKSILKNLDLEESLPAFSNSLETTASDFKDYPTLIYDGPFSDHIAQKEPLWLKGKAEISADDAKKKAAEFFQIDSAQLANAGETAGNFPAYNFTTQQARISITKAGGLASSLLNSRKVEEASLTIDQAKEKALAFLQKNGMDHLAESYYVVYDNICTIQYAFAQDDITFYPDLIKVSVALDNGEIMEYNGSGYLMNHHDRQKQSPALTEQQAADKVSDRLSIQKAGLAVIPTASMKEVLCYEFLCAGSNGEEVLVYINAATGMEEQIFIIVHDDSGTLVV